MPMSAIQRAEKVLLNICFDLRKIQVNSLEFQSKINKDTQTVYSQKIHHARVKTGIDIFTLAAGMSSLAQKAEWIPYAVPSEAIQPTTNMINGFWAQPKDISHDMEMHKFNAQAQENTTWTSGIGSILQTYERALEQLRSVENNIRS
ncbi:hypothetical protein [Rhabdochlamydiaceae symbiont of Dictyostelium giganteum]|uniref:hypothetical protein n=1 Tax=Rhabdochlamydiaceae symbiont of Dictyostelium giganteum TaxID=3342349 RepID=UPI0038506D06